MPSLLTPVARRHAGARAILVLSLALVAPSVALGQQAAVQLGTLTGTVIDRESGRPIPFTVIDVVGTTRAAQADLDGRYRLSGIALGIHQVRARRIGYQSALVDSVRVTTGAAVILNFTLATAVRQLEGMTVKVAADKASEASLLAMQKAAPAVSDGISSQGMARAPTANAADAITRVTGVSVVEKKFAVVRGLPERYNNTLLNGVDLPSPEPLRKIVPLDVFPSSLLESIVATKTATPDKPGDFAGGSVEIRTKDFPENRVAQFSVSQDWNSLSSFRNIPYEPMRGVQWLGFSGSSRKLPPIPQNGAKGEEMERFAESLRDVWAPASRTNLPGLGLGAGLGDRFGDFGYALSLTYSARNDRQPGRLYQFVADSKQGTAERGFISKETQSVVDWGASANLNWLLGSGSKIGLKNLYTRNAEESIAENDAFETYRSPPERLRTYQVKFVERQLIQSQLTGDHVLGFLNNMRLEWKATYSTAQRDEPDNRTATYSENPRTGIFALQPSRQTLAWFRFLTDQVVAGNLDLTQPIGIWGGREMLFKTGGLYRAKDRSFNAEVFTFTPSFTPPSGVEVFSLPPEQAFAPEHLGTISDGDIGFARRDALALPYKSYDDLGAGYAMLDLPLLSWLRMVGGARAERWMLDVRPNSGVAAYDSATTRRELDILGSLNLTASLTDRMSVRLAGYQTVARPDPRELTNDYYVAVTGECGNQGSSDLRHTRIDNADVRWELYPGGNELVAISGFYKQFKRPVVEVVSLPQSTTCIAYYKNAESATNYGGELELRKSLGFLPLIPPQISGNVNLTIVHTETDLGKDLFNVHAKFMGQSPYVVNGGLSYDSRGGALTVSVFANAFGDRIVRYGATLVNIVTDPDGTRHEDVTQIPHVYERGRMSLDAKIQTQVWRGTSVALSARNLANQAQRFYQSSEAGQIQTGFIRPGVTVRLTAATQF